jgi:hypothetical protein
LKLEISRYLKRDDKLWDDFVWTANNGTIFHTRKFLAYHPPDRFKDHSLLFYDKGRIVALLPAVDVLFDERRTLMSHRGASYGSFVVRDSLSIREAFDLVEAMLAYCRGQGFESVDLTPPPQIYLHRPSNYVDFALVQNGFTYRKREVSSMIPLDFPREQILNTFIESSRRAVRRGQKLGVIVRESEDYRRFYEILKKNLRLRHGVNPTHTLDELLYLRKIFPDRIHLFAAYHENIMVAGVVMFICNPRVVLAFYISHDEEYQQYRGVNCLFHDIIDWGIQNGYGFLDYGIFTVNEDPNWGLARFKESFGAQGIFRDSLRCYLE